MVALEIMGFDGAGLSVGQTLRCLPLSCVALYFIWHLAAAAVLDAVGKTPKMALAIQPLFPAM